MDSPESSRKRVCRHDLGKEHEDLGPSSDIYLSSTQIKPKETRQRQSRISKQGVPKAFKSRYILGSIQRAIDYMTHACRHCGALHWLEERSNTSKPEPEFESCCKHGNLKLPPLQPIPLFFQQLLTSTDTESRTFCQKLRRYNNALAFTSVNYTLDRRVKSKRGPLCFRIHGELYHLQGPLKAIDDSPQFAQLFFYDPEEATQYCMTQHEDLDPDILRRLTHMLNKINPYIPLYKTAKEALDESAITNKNLKVILNLQMRLVMETGTDRRRHNLPSSGEVLGIIADEYGEPCQRDIILTERVNGIEKSSLKQIH